MPYEISFARPVKVTDVSSYINECCYGGDVVGEQLFPEIEKRYVEVQFNQEDWGWFIWCR